MVSLVFNFGYLAFFRMASYLGFDEVSTGTPNAVQLILSLKVRTNDFCAWDLLAKLMNCKVH